MKKIVALFFAILLCLTTAFAETIHLDLPTATDEELADALQKIVAEQKSRIKTTLTLNHTELTLGKGKQATLTATINGMEEGVAKPKVTWTTSDKKIATVSSGRVTAVTDGTATITATIVLENGMELTAECKVTVVISVSSLTVKKSSYTLYMNETVTMETAIAPKNATNKDLKYESSDTTVAKVDALGRITAVGGGKCKVTAFATDGSGKSVSCNVKVSSFGYVPETANVVMKKGQTFKWKYYGKMSNFDCTISSGAYADVSYGYESNNTLVFTIIPIKAGTFTLTLKDKSDSSNNAVCKMTIDPKATYSKQSYPSINYDGAARYPASYKGDQTSFSGKVLQVIEGYGYTSYRISSKGNYDNVVYVTLDDDNVTVPLIEDDAVTVYGKYDGNYSYTTVFGSKMTIPKVEAERINLK